MATMKTFGRRICSNCNEKYIPTQSRQHYCKECYIIDIPCSFCSKKITKRRTFYNFFMKKNSNRKWFCSKDCRKKYRIENETEIRCCEECGKKFNCWLFSKTKLCSSTCREKAQTPQKIKIICEQCGSEFYDWPSRNRIHCSQRCAGLGRTPWNKGIPWDNEAKKKMRISHLGKSNPHIGVPWTIQSKEKVSKSLKNAYATGKIIISTKERKNRSNRIIKLMADGKMPQNDTMPERIFENQLLFNNILYIKQYPYKYGIADFWLPEDNIIVEIDGEYWHNQPKVRERDKRQNIYLEENGYTLFRFTDREIKQDINKCIEKVLK